MRRLVFGLALLATMPALAPAAIAAPPGSAERLVAPALPGFVLGYSAGNAAQSIREEVPRGETVQVWTRMVTTQRFTGLASRTTPAAYARTILAQLPQACPGASASPVASLKVSGRDASQFQVDCPRNGTGQRETFILLAIAGRSDMHVKQVAFRGRAAPADLAWGRNYLAATVLCQPGDRKAACQG